MAYADQLGLTDEAAFSLAAGFGGGIARNGEVCGAVSGAVMVLGMIHGQPGDDPEKAKEETAVKVKEFIVAFKKETGALKCSEIIDGIDLLKSEGRQEWSDRKIQESKCLPAIQNAVNILEELINDSKTVRIQHQGFSHRYCCYFYCFCS